MVKFNSVQIVTPINVGAWEDRPSGAADGDFFQVTGSALYVYSSAIGEWVRPFVYAGTPVLDARIRGSVVPTSETPAWHFSGSGTHAEATDGEWVTLSRSGHSHMHCWYEHEQVMKNHFMQGYVEQTSYAGDTGGFIMRDGVKLGWLQLGNQTNTERLDTVNLGQGGDSESDDRLYINNFTNVAGGGSSGTSSPLRYPRYLEFYLAASGSTRGLIIYVDHELNPSIVCNYEKLVDHGEAADTVYSASTWRGLTSGSVYFIGGTRTNAGSGISYRLKQTFWGRY